MFTNIKIDHIKQKLKPWMWFVGIYLASVSAIAIFEFGSRWLLHIQ